MHLRWDKLSRCCCWDCVENIGDIRNKSGHSHVTPLSQRDHGHGSGALQLSGIRSQCSVRSELCHTLPCHALPVTCVMCDSNAGQVGGPLLEFVNWKWIVTVMTVVGDFFNMFWYSQLIVTPCRSFSGIFLEIWSFQQSILELKHRDGLATRQPS